MGAFRIQTAAQPYNPSSWETNGKQSQIQDQSRLHSEIFSQTTKQTDKNNWIDQHGDPSAHAPILPSSCSSTNGFPPRL